MPVNICPICGEPVRASNSDDTIVCPIEYDYKQCHFSCFYQTNKQNNGGDTESDS